jgi:hypothetical protein
VKTNSKGSWSLPNLAPGTYTVTAALTSYTPKTINMTATAGKTVLAATELAHA